MMRKTKRDCVQLIGLTLLLVMILGGCGGGGSNSGGGGDTGDNIAFVVTTDYTSGNFSTINLDTLTASSNLGTAGMAEGDNTAAYHNGRIYIINRLGSDNITVIDRDDPATALNQFSTGNGTNPYAMAFNSDTEAYVCLYASNDLLVVDPTDTTAPLKGTIDLSVFMAAGDTDGAVEAAAMVKVNDYLFVALQRQNTFTVENDALLVVIDTTTNEFVDADDSTQAVDAITLTGRNPQFMQYDDVSGKIFISETGAYGTTDGGIETVDPVSLEAEGYLVDESELGGDVGAIAVTNGTGYIVVDTGTWTDPENTIASFDANGTKGSDLAVFQVFVPSVSIDNQGRLFVPDRTTTAPGVRIYDTGTDTEITTDAIDVGLPPNVILVD